MCFQDQMKFAQWLSSIGEDLFSYQQDQATLHIEYIRQIQGMLYKHSCLWFLHLFIYLVTLCEMDNFHRDTIRFFMSENHVMENIQKCVVTAGVECLCIGVEFHRKEGLHSIRLPHLVTLYFPFGRLDCWRGFASKAWNFSGFYPGCIDKSA